MTLLRAVRADKDDASFGVGLTYGTLELGYALLGPGSAALRATAGFAAGAMHTVVYSPEPTGAGDLFWPAVVATVVAQVRLAGPMTGEFGVRGLVPWGQYRLKVEGPNEPVFSASPVGGEAHVGIGVEFP